MLNTTVNRKDVVTITCLDSPLYSNVWLKMTPEELQALRDQDKVAGRWCDDGGEPILYGTYMGWPEGFKVMMLVVTSRRPKWEGHRRRPTNLRAGFSVELNREVLFQAL